MTQHSPLIGSWPFGRMPFWPASKQLAGNPHCATHRGRLARSWTVVFALLIVGTQTAAAQLKLSEPPEDAESGTTQSEKPSLKESTSPRLRNRSKSRSQPKVSEKSAPRSIAPRELNQPPEAEQGPDPVPVEMREAPSTLSTPQQQNSIGNAAESGSQRSQPLTLVSHDQEPPGFFSGPVPRSVAIGEDATLNDVCHVGTSCWAVGERGVICSSIDHGQTWTTQFTPMECSLKSVCFLTNRIGWVAGIRSTDGTSRLSSVLLHTRDGGRSWIDLAAAEQVIYDAQSVSASSLPGLLHVQFFGLDEAIAISLPVAQRGGNAIWQSSDGGRSWNPIPSDQPGGVWTAAAFLNPSEGIVVGQQQAYGTVVANQTVVINRPQSTLRQMRGASLSPDGNGWIVGDGATILSTKNSGVTWQTSGDQLPRKIAELTDLHTVAHQDSIVLLAGNPGSTLLRSTDEGLEWTVHELPMSGYVHCMKFVGPETVLAVGSLGQILRSKDGGITWQCVRSAGFRSGLLNLVTDADALSTQLLANNSGENGVRSVVLQMSQPMPATEIGTHAENTRMSDRSQLQCVLLGGNEAAADWMFPRTKPEHHRSASQLISEWNRQTDGQLRRLLPLRLARDLRNWKPSVVVIEPVSDDDAVALLLRDVTLRAIELAAAGDDESQILHDIGLPAWQVARVVVRVPASQQTGLTFANNDLLANLGTSTGLLCDAVGKVFPTSIDHVQTQLDRAGYEIVMDQNHLPSVARLFDSLDGTALQGAVRTVNKRSREETDRLAAVLQAAHLQGTALRGHTQLNKSEGSLIAELRGLGADLPETLALKQLRDLAALNLEQNNMEGYLAVQQEVIRRFPDSEDGRTAAEMLYLFYSSAESRHFRVRSSMKPSQSMPIPEVAAQSADPFRPVENALLVQPQLQAAVSSPFSAGASNQMATLMEHWDTHADTALRILSTNATGTNARREISPQIQLRFAASQRLKDRTGGSSNALADLSQRNDEFGVFARSEMQLHAAAVPGLPIFNLPRQTDRPFLDAKLTDTIWENSDEIPLRPFERSESAADDEAGDVRPVVPSSVHSLTMLAWDEEYLYVAARLERDPSATSAVELATHRSHDAKHENRDRFELEIDTDRDFSTSFQFCIDESGLTSDRCWLLDRWNPKWFVAVDSDESTWRFEAAIPLEELSARPAKPGDLWAVRMRRIQPGVLKHELPSGNAAVSANGTGFIRFIRPKVVTGSRSK